jgi:xylan 1,4-beta-xylosidase
MLRIQQTEMPFRYIKFHGIFDDALKVYQEDRHGKPILNFYYTDKILDFLLEIKLIPMLQLSFMPEAMAKYPDRTIFHHPFIISEPKEDAKWEYLVREFTKHVLQRYGLKQVNTWIFTFWNETLNDFPFDFPEVDTSLRLYELSYKTVKALLPEVYFASTSHVLCDFPCENYRTFLDYTRLHECVPDAYLFNFYSTSRKLLPGTFGSFYDQTSGEILRHTMSSDMNQFHKNIASLQAFFGEQPDAPIYITEWNFTSSHREWLNDTCFTSCYIVRNILQNYDKLDSFCHWSLTDLLEELPPDVQTFHGGMGFFTRDGIKKPAYYAYYLLTKLENIFVMQQEGFFVTRNEDGTRYSIMLYNYHHFSDIYGDGIDFSNTFTERYLEFPTSCAVKYNLSLTNLKSGEYLMKQTYVNRNHGSVFDQWLKMSSQGNAVPMQLTTPEEIETLKYLSVPMLLKDSVTTMDGSLALSIELEPHEIRLLQLELI